MDLASNLPAIPVLETDSDFPYATLLADEERAHLLIDGATRLAPKTALSVLDRISRRWLSKWNNAHLEEIDRIAARLDRPGAYFLSVNYEWGCTVGVHASPDNSSARLARVLDWRTPGLGRYVVAAKVRGNAGPFITLTWPGYTGVLQAMAPKRFAAALNQAPMPRRGGGVYPFDWLANKVRTWNSAHATPAHVLRDTFEQARSFHDARRMLIETPIAAPVIYSLAGLAADELSIIERTETEAHVHDGANAAANAWQAPGWHGRERGHDSQGRAQQMLCDVVDAAGEMSLDFDWLKPPILNDRTRLAMTADARAGRLIAQGFECDGPATRPLHLEW
ncbi:MAG: hypothetical protein ACR2PA_24315 [Hyphomicrobiaceae bacterium]